MQIKGLESGELDKVSTVKEFLTVQKDRSRIQYGTSKRFLCPIGYDEISRYTNRNLKRNKVNSQKIFSNSLI
jgi:hypothetical protein